MNKDNIPDIFVNKENFIRLSHESQQYRRAYRVTNFFALVGWSVVLYLSLKG